MGGAIEGMSESGVIGQRQDNDQDDQAPDF